MNKKLVFHSRTKTPWDGEDDLSPLEVGIKKKYLRNFENKHERPSKDDAESAFLNSLKISSCPYCSGTKFIKYGYTKNKVQRYKCLSCNNTFTPITGTLLDSHKLSIFELIEFIISLIHFESFNSASRNNKNSINTTKYRFGKICKVLRNFQNNIILSGKFYLDETYFKVRTKDVRKVNGKELRGLSINQLCIAAAVDEKNNKLFFLIGHGKPSSRKILEVFLEHITPKSTLIHDSEKAHNLLISALQLNEKRYNSQKLRGIKDVSNPLNTINQEINFLKKFLRQHQGFKRDKTQDLLNVYCFISDQRIDELTKVKILISKLLNCNKTLRYADFYAKNKENWLE